MGNNAEWAAVPLRMDNNRLLCVLLRKSTELELLWSSVIVQVTGVEYGRSSARTIRAAKEEAARQVLVALKCNSQ